MFAGIANGRSILDLFFFCTGIAISCKDYNHRVRLCARAFEKYEHVSEFLCLVKSMRFKFILLVRHWPL